MSSLSIRKDAVLVSVILMAVLLVGTGMGTVTAQSAPDCSTVTYNGDGSGFNPYEVGNIDQLQCINDQGLFADYVQVSDIDASETKSWNSGKGFVPIANDTDSGFGFQGTEFTGSFDGAGYNISDLYINRASTDFVGMFGGVRSAGRVENVNLNNANITGSRFTGGLAGRNNGFVTDSYANGNVSGGTVGGLVGQNDISGIVTESHATVRVEEGGSIGGLVGQNIGSVRESYATGDVSGFGSNVGGFVGGNSGNVTDSYATGNVSGIEEVGGLVGGNSGNVTDSHATGSVSGDVLAGGLVGSNSRGTVADSYATGDVDGSRRVGGLVGGNFNNVTESYATGDVSGTRVAGGFVGENFGGNVSDSYATGSVSAGDFVGGFAGVNDKVINGDGNITDSYATGSVTGGRNLGGFVGGNGATVTDSYWDTESTGQSDAVGMVGGSPTLENVDGLPTDEMFGDAAPGNMTAFDFTDTWMTVTDPEGYPILAWQSREEGGTGGSPVEGVSDGLWTAVTQDDGSDGLSLADLGNAIQEYQKDPSDATIDGVSIGLSELGSLIQYYRTEVV